MLRMGCLARVIEGDDWECNVGDIHLIIHCDLESNDQKYCGVMSQRCALVNGRYIPNGSTYCHSVRQFKPFKQVASKKEFAI